MRKLGREGVRLRFCYEARPCGYGIQRQLSTSGHECVVVAPSRGSNLNTPRRLGGSR
jgi:transposase